MTWALVYRTEKYQKLKLEIEKQSKKLEKKKEAVGETVSLDRSKKKKLEQDEEKLKNTNRDMTLVKMKSMFAIGKITNPSVCFLFSPFLLCKNIYSVKTLLIRTKIKQTFKNFLIFFCKNYNFNSKQYI